MKKDNSKFIYYKMNFILFLIFLVACTESPVKETWTTFEGRLPQIPIYRAKLPENWTLLLPDTDAYLSDTTLPIFSFKISHKNEELILHVHNFPTSSIEESIPSKFQVQRWKNQFQSIDPVSLNIAELSYNGFTGYLFEATGFMNKTESSVLAIAMQIIPEHYRMLENQPHKEKEHRQMRADYTIKVIGSPEAIAQKREEILVFAESFELIQAIPASL